MHLCYSMSRAVHEHERYFYQWKASGERVSSRSPSKYTWPWNVFILITNKKLNKQSSYLIFNISIHYFLFQDKTGSCPALPPVTGPCASDVDECFMDSDCVKDKKCCSNGCFTICVPPAKTSITPAAAGRRKECDWLQHIFTDVKLFWRLETRVQAIIHINCLNKLLEPSNA